MFSTIVFAITFIGLLLASILLWAWFLGLGLRWARVPEVTRRRVVYATAIVIGLETIFNLLLLWIPVSSQTQANVLGLVGLAATVLVPCLVISRVFKASYFRAFQAFLVTILATLLSIALAIFVVRPFVFEAFKSPTNAMAPTLLGQHWQATCPQCGQPNYSSPLDGRYVPPTPPRMICQSMHVTAAPVIDKTVHDSDRFLVAKFLTAKRWDVVVFQCPGDPAILYVMRLVGLPGEKIHIKDGSVWVDGERQSPPGSIKGIEYLTAIPEMRGAEIWGSEENPAVLGEDECFVLGDFSAQSMDSRYWQAGAPGHNAFAVPRSYMKGVVTHTFWPVDRWRILR